MFDAAPLDRVADELDGIVRALDVERVGVGDAKRLVSTFARMGRQVDAALALLSARVSDGGATDREVSRWLAAETRSGRREADERLRAGAAVRGHEATRRAMQSGAVAAGTAGAIGAAASADPASEARLLGLAQQGSADDARREAHRAQRAARRESEAERERRRHRNRSFTSWEDDEGGIAGRFDTTAWQWAPIGATLGVFREAAFAKARRTGEQAARGTAYSMDALALMSHVAAGGAPADLGYVDADLPAALRRRLAAGSPAATGASPSATITAEGAPAASSTDVLAGAGSAEGDPSPEPGGEPSGPEGDPSPEHHVEALGPEGPSGAPAERASAPAPDAVRSPAPPGLWKVIVRIDADALRRGHAEPGEVCDIAGVGPVPVEQVRRILPEAFVATVITKGRDVLNVAHPGRRPDAFQVTAMQWRSDECCTRGCGHRARLEADHDDPWAATHYTWLPGLNGACHQCHERKTLDGYAWVGEPDDLGKRELVAPDDPRHPDRTGARPPRPPTVRPPRRPAAGPADAPAPPAAPSAGGSADAPRPRQVPRPDRRPAGDQLRLGP